MKNFLIILISFSFTIIYGQEIKKGFKLLEKKEYAKAMESFRKDIAQNPGNIGANLGMALVLADDQSTVFNIIDAWQYIEAIQGKINDLSSQDIEILNEYFLNTEVRKTSRPVKKKVEIAMEAVETRFIKYIREENNLEAVYEALNRYPNFKHHDNIIHIRNQFEYRKYEKMNTLEGYSEFISKFPEAAQVEKAIKARNKLAFEKAKQQNTVAGYMAYIAAYPKSEYLQSVIILRNAAAYAEAKKVNSMESYGRFIDQYPDALEVSEATVKKQQLVYEQAKRVNSLDAFNKFIKLYPDGQYFVDIFNLKANELGAKYLRDYSLTGSSIQWAKGFDNNGRIESGGKIARAPDGNFIIACNTRDGDTAHSDAWILKIDNAGRILWNKTIGQAYDDEVDHILIDANGDLIFLGYTWLLADEASKMGWMFKLGSDGRKIWNKNLGKIQINSCVLDENGHIVIAGAQGDSLATYYSVTVFNKEAQIISERIYSGKGEFNDVVLNPGNGLFFCGSNWICSTDDRFYIKWDNTIDAANTATHADYASDKGFYVAGTNQSKIFYALYGPTGTKSWYQSYDKSDPSQKIKAIASVSGENLVVLEQKDSGGKIKLFSPTGSLLRFKDVMGMEISNEDVLKDGNGAILILNNGDLFIVKYTDLNDL